MFVCVFYKQKTAYEMRISDWSSDVCSSDLLAAIEYLGVDAVEAHDVALARQHVELDGSVRQHDLAALRQHDVEIELVRQSFPQFHRKIGRASCRERVCQFV